MKYKIKNIIIISLLGFIVSSCDVCNNSDTNIGENSSYFYMTSIINSNEEPNIIKIDTETGEFYTLIDNGRIYSPPSINNRIAFLRKSNGIQYLLISDLNTNNIIELEKENEIFGIAYPRICPNDEQIAFFGGNGKLFIYNLKDRAIDKVSTKYYDMALFSFSPDGRYIAYAEKHSDKNFIIKVKELNNLDNEVLSYPLNSFSFINLANNMNMINWNKKSSKIVVSGILNEENKILIIDLNNKINTVTISEKLGANKASISPNGSCLVFIADDGNLWFRSLNLENPIFEQLTHFSSIEKCINFLWVGSELNIGYITSINIFNEDESALKQIALKYDDSLPEVIQKRIITNNIFNMYWR